MELAASLIQAPALAMETLRSASVQTRFTSFTFTYGSGSGTAADPTYQHVGIYNLDFAVVPEINPAYNVLLVCLLAAGLTIRQQRNADAMAKNR